MSPPIPAPPPSLLPLPSSSTPQLQQSGRQLLPNRSANRSARDPASMRGGGGDDDGSDVEGTQHNISHEAHRTFGNEQLTTDQKQLYVLGLKAMLEVGGGGVGGGTTRSSCMCWG